MAFNWVSKIRRLIPVGRTEEDDEVLATSGEVAAANDGTVKPAAPPTAESAPSAAGEPPPWLTMVVDQTPYIMFVVGVLLSACAQLIQVWAFLGFLLIACSPIVFWLRRLEKRLRELTEAVKKKDTLRR